MLLEYVRAAMAKAEYERLPDDRSYYGRIPGFKGVWANANTLKACRRELQRVLEDWILVTIRFNDRLPTVDGLRIRLPRAASGRIAEFTDRATPGWTRRSPVAKALSTKGTNRKRH
jgi:predicted RNase H-like HicB family nuclease